MCPLCKRTVLPSSDDSDVSDSEEAPLLENEVTPNEGIFISLNFIFYLICPKDERTPRVVTWARAFANHIRDSDSDNQSTGPRRSQSVDGMIQDSSFGVDSLYRHVFEELGEFQQNIIQGCLANSYDGNRCVLVS